MACNKCNSCKQLQNSPEKDYKCEQRLTISYVPDTGCTVAFVFDGLATTLDMSQGIKNCETVTQLSFNESQCRLEFRNELFTSSEGEESMLDIVSAKTIAGCINLEDLSNVESVDPVGCSFLMFNAAEDMWQPYSPEVVSEVGGLYGYTTSKCVVKIDDPSESGQRCYIMTHQGDSAAWRPTPFVGALTRDRIVRIDTDGCLQYGSLPVWGACDVAIPMQTMVAEFGRGTLSQADGNVAMGSGITVVDPGCPWQVTINLRGYVDMLPHLNGGHPFHVNIKVDLDTPGNTVMTADHWHDGTTVDSVNGWSDSASATKRLSLTGSRAFYLTISTDLDPAFAVDIENLYAHGEATFIVTRQF